MSTNMSLISEILVTYEAPRNTDIVESEDLTVKT